MKATLVPLSASRASLHPESRELGFSRVLEKENILTETTFKGQKKACLALQCCLHCRTFTQGSFPPCTDGAFMPLRRTGTCGYWSWSLALQTQSPG